MKTVKIRFSFLSVAVVIMAVAGMMSCSKSSSGGGTPPPTLIGGYASSDSVQQANLVAYWPLDADVNDHKGNVAGTGVNVSYVPGVRGQAYQGSATTYATFSPSAAMQGLTSFSVSLWYWQTAQPIGTPNSPQGMFFLADANGANPDIIVENEHYAPVSGDSLQLHAGLTFPAAPMYQGWTMATFDTAAIGKWVHFAMTYNGGTSTYVVYQDGKPMNNASAYGVNLSTILLQGPLGSTPQGNIDWSTSPPVEGTIGTWAAGVYGISNPVGTKGNYLGKLDEIRLFKVALTGPEVAGLYLNGLAGR